MDTKAHNHAGLSKLINKAPREYTIGGETLYLTPPSALSVRDILSKFTSGDADTPPEDGMDMLIKIVGLCLRVEDDDLVWNVIVASGGLSAKDSPLVRECMSLCGMEGDVDVLEPASDAPVNRKQRRAAKAKKEIQDVPS